MAKTSPSVSQRRVGLELRRLRTQAGLTLDQVAAEMEWSASKVSRVENGQVRVLARDVRLLSEFLGADHAVSEALVGLTRQAKVKGWWEAYRDVLSGNYIPFEAGATEVNEFQIELVPALLQVAPYIRAVMRGSRLGDSDEEIERHVQVRLDRQVALDRPESPLRLWAVISEAALYRKIGGPDVLQAQLEHIVTRTEQANIDVQVLPYDAGAHPALVTTFSILLFTDAEPIAFSNQLLETPPVEEPGDTQRYVETFNYLRAAAESPERSHAIIADAARAVKGEARRT